MRRAPQTSRTQAADRPSRNAILKLGPIGYRSIEAIREYANNPRKHPEKQIVKLMASISEFGIVLPLLVDSFGVLVAGHGVLAAAKRLGYRFHRSARPSGHDEEWRRAVRASVEGCDETAEDREAPISFRAGGAGPGGEFRQALPCGPPRCRPAAHPFPRQPAGGGVGHGAEALQRAGVGSDHRPQITRDAADLL